MPTATTPADTTCRICTAGPFAHVPARPDPTVCLDCAGREIAAGIEAHAKSLGMVVDLASSTTNLTNPRPALAAAGWTHTVALSKPRGRTRYSIALAVADDGTVTRATSPARLS